MSKPILLGVNIDHVATLRQARGTSYPNVLAAAQAVVDGGADGITIHLREDRRHIQDQDVEGLHQQHPAAINLEMAATDEMLNIARRLRPGECCLVPERREELTTEGGLNAAAQIDYLTEYCQGLAEAGIKVSLFIDPEPEQIEASSRIGVSVVELHTGQYAEATDSDSRVQELSRLQEATTLGAQVGLQVNAGHGLHYDNVHAVATIPGIVCLNIGHAVVARALFTGLERAVREMKRLMVQARDSQ